MQDLLTKFWGKAHHLTWRKSEIKLSSLHQSPLNLCPPPLLLYFFGGGKQAGKEGDVALWGILNIVFTACWGKSLARSICEFVFGPGVQTFHYQRRSTQHHISRYWTPLLLTRHQGRVEMLGEFRGKYVGVDAVRMTGSKRSKINVPKGKSEFVKKSFASCNI